VWMGSAIVPRDGRETTVIQNWGQMIGVKIRPVSALDSNEVVVIRKCLCTALKRAMHVFVETVLLSATTSNGSATQTQM